MFLKIGKKEKIGFTVSRSGVEFIGLKVQSICSSEMESCTIVWGERMLFKFRIIEAMAFVTNIALWSDFIIPGEICRILGGILK